MDVFERAGCDGWLYVTTVDGPGEVAYRADDAVVSASVFKVLVALEFFRQAEAGAHDVRERIRVSPADRTAGSTGFSTFTDEVEVSLRDLAHMMLVVSDNAATDVLLARTGLDAVNATARSLGLAGTVVESSLRTTVDAIGTDAGFAGWDDLQAATGPDAPPAFVEEVRQRLATVGALTPARATRTTAREAAILLGLIWRDEAGPAAACAPVRRSMAGQVTRNRLAAGFGHDVRVSAKSGSLLGVVRNEVGVVEYPDGARYAVAVFTRAHRPFRGEAAINAAIGTAAATAVESLRAPNGPAR